MNDSLISIEGLEFSYNKGEPILHDINLQLNQGEVFCIIGPNGCGKSTLLDCILRINNPNKGKILISNKDSHKFKPYEYAEYISYVPQKHIPTFSYTVFQIVSMGNSFRQKFLNDISKEDEETVEKAISEVGLSHLKDRDYTTLSGGELQLVMIARALASKSKILIMDEPTAHLDFKHELNIMELITRLVKEQKLAIIMATHFLNQAYYLENAEVPTSVGLISNGTFITQGKPSEVLTPKNLEETFDIITEIATDKTGECKYILSLRNKEWSK